MKRLGIQTAILSITAPGACFPQGQESFDLAREINDYGAELRDKEHQNSDMFASLPSLLDTQAALDEIAYALDTLHAEALHFSLATALAMCTSEYLGGNTKNI